MSQGNSGAWRGSGAPNQSTGGHHTQAWHLQSSGSEPPQRLQPPQAQPWPSTSSGSEPPQRSQPPQAQPWAYTSPPYQRSQPPQAQPWPSTSSGSEQSQRSQPQQAALLGLLNEEIGGHSPAAPPAPTIFHTLQSPPPTQQYARPPSPNDRADLGPRQQDHPNLSRFPVHGREDVGARAYHPAHPAAEAEQWAAVPSDPRVHQERERKKPKAHPSHTASGVFSAMDYAQYESGGSSSLPPPVYHPVTSPTLNPAHIPTSPPSFTSAMTGHSTDSQNRGNTAWPGGNNENFAPTLDQRAAQLPRILERVYLQSTSTTGDPERFVQPPFQHNLIQLLKTLREEGRKTADQGAVRHLVNLLSNDYEKVPSLLHDNNDIKNIMEFLLYQLDHNSLGNTGYEEANKRARRLLIKLGMDKATIPNSLKIDPSKIMKNPEPFDYGGYADVFEGRFRDEHVALKRIRYPINDKDLCREVLAWRTVSHKCLLRFIGVYIDPSQRVHLVSPLMKETLSDWRKRGRLTVSEIQNHMLSAAEGLRYLHWKGVIHGDIRGSNILLDHHHQAKIADFGLARHSDGTGTNNETMSAPFTAPELFCGTGELKRTTKTDVYAFGCLFYEIHFGVLPFVGGVYNIGQTVRRGQRPRRLKEPLLHDEAWKLMQCCWDMEPTKRPSVDDVVQNVNFWCHPPVLT